MKLKQIYLAIALMLIGFATSVATPPVATQEREVISSGGGTSSGAAYSNFSVVGEPVVGVVTSGTFQGSTHGFIADFPKQTNAPVATSYFPAVNSIINAADVTQLEITFDEPITIGASGSLILYKITSTGDVVVKQFTTSDTDVEIIGNQLTASMSGTTLDKGSSYYVNIAGGFVKDLDDYDFAGITNATDWKFSVPITAPTARPGLTVYNPGRTSVTLNVAIGDPDSKVLVVASKSNISISWTPENAHEYLSSTAYAQFPANTSLVTGGQVYAVYNGSSSRITVTGLAKSTKYYFKAFAYNSITGDVTSYMYNTEGVEVWSRTGSKEDGEYQIGEKEFSGNFSVCKVNPNPVNTELNFCIDAQEEANFTIELFNVSGEKVFSQVQFLKSGSNSMKVDLATQAAGVSAGTYFLKVTANDESLTQQVVVIP